MRVFIILYGDTNKPDSDEVKGFMLNAIDARNYCEKMNNNEKGSGAYYFEPADLIK